MSYYRLEVKEDLVSVVHDYDYSDNDRTNYLRDPDDKDYYLRFDSERAAQLYLNEKIKPEHIHPDWLKIDLDQEKFFK